MPGLVKNHIFTRSVKVNSLPIFFEDNIRISKERLAANNAELVEHAVLSIERHGRRDEIMVLAESFDLEENQIVVLDLPTHWKSPRPHGTRAWPRLGSPSSRGTRTPSW